jgi:Tol biopolymer transport system component
VIDEREIVRRAVEALDPPEPAFERLRHRRDRKRRNQRIAAGVVGIVVFVAAVWIVTSVGSLDRSETPAVPGPTETGPAVTEPREAIGPVPETDYLLDLSTGEMTPLPEGIAGTAGAGASEYAASPDGSRLAYTDRGDNGGRQIFVANLDGTGIEQVTHDPGAADSPAWSPDGSKIAYIGDHRYLRELFVLDLATGESTQLTFATHAPDPAAPGWSPWSAFVPSFTPDGASIVYSTSRCDARCVEEEDELRMVPVAGGESVRLMEGGFYDADLSPDGSLLAYAWPTPTSNCVCVSNTDGTGERVLVYGGGDAINGTPWSPDGTLIAYYTFHAQDVFVVNVTTGQPTYVGEGSHPTWLDDQTLIVEMSSRCYNPETGSREISGCGG